MRLFAPRTLALALLSGGCLLAAAGTVVAPGPKTAPGHGGSVAASAVALTARTAHSRPRPGVVTIPEKTLSRLTRLLHPRRPGGANAASVSTNWAGYAASGANFAFQSVTASWVQPAVSCTTNGIVVFWAGLDGFNSPTVEQTGTGVDCTTGSPRLFAWWELYPAVAIQELNDPVAVGDHLTATVDYVRRRMSLELTDSTQGWTDGSGKLQGYSVSSAEVIAEAASSGGAVTPLPAFQPITFTGSQVVPGSSTTFTYEPIQAAGAQAINMVNGGGGVIASTGPIDSGGDFTVTRTG